MNCADHINERLAFCPSCLANYWMDKHDKKRDALVAAEQEVRNLHDDLKEADGAVNDLMDKLTSIRNAALDAAAKVLQKQVDAEEFGGELTDKGCIIEECIDAIERMKEE